MGLTMKQILNKFSDCNKFSLTGNTFRYNVTISKEEFEAQTKDLTPKEMQKFTEQFYEKYIITEEEYLNALKTLEERNKEEKRKIYENNREKFAKYPSFDKLYDEIKKECEDYDCEENKQFYINKHYGDEQIKKYKDRGMTEEEINEMKEDFFQCTFIASEVGKTTKYGNEHKGFFYHLYYDIANNIDRQKNKEHYCIDGKISPMEQIPQELKENFLYYEISFFNSVTTGGLMINYYFNLNDETKKYLLKFRNDLYIYPLEDLTFYKEDKIKFYSCTHEGFNSIEFNYKNMTNNEIIDYINDEYFEEDNSETIKIINKLINMEIGTTFLFTELGITSKTLMNKICNICDGLKLILISAKEKEHSWSTINENGGFEKIEELPAILCNLEDLIQKKQ